MPHRGGGLSYVPPQSRATAPLPEEAELIWDDGNGVPEPFLDDHSKYGVSTSHAIFAVLVAFGSLTAFYKAIAWWDPVAHRPVGPHHLPYDNLRIELGGDPSIPVSSDQ